jgi:hypothetical protein
VLLAHRYALGRNPELLIGHLLLRFVYTKLLLFSMELALEMVDDRFEEGLSLCSRQLIFSFHF